ncbi:hypothetical protein BH10ACI3_BH10ACI3_13090 [soil metagenome]
MSAICLFSPLAPVIAFEKEPVSSLPLGGKRVKHFRVENAKIHFLASQYMPEYTDNQQSDIPAFDPVFQTENIAFAAADLVACNKCGRSNAPNRLKCLYCAAELPIRIADPTAVKPALRSLEFWEPGFNIIVSSDGNADTSAIARYLSIESQDVSAVIDTAIPLPIARVETQTEADVVMSALERFGLRCKIITDAELSANETPIRLRGIEIHADSLVFTAFNTGEKTDIAIADLALIVPGLITASRVDALEKKGRGGKSKLIDETATATDETILDLYTCRDALGYRIHLTGFDFSCLGAEKGMLAGDNMRRLVAWIAAVAPNAKIIDSYNRIRQPLGRVWQVESRTDFQGLQRSGFGKVEFGSIASTNNLNQFTKFSRLQWHLL